MRILNLLWILPFICFFFGYLFTSYVCGPSAFNTPQLIGQSLSHALLIMSDHQLNPRVLTVKHDADLPEGTIISQSPSAGQKIKPHQSIYVGITQKPPKITIPDVRQKSKTLIQQALEQTGIRHKMFSVPSNYPSDYCCAQIPDSQESIDPSATAIFYFKYPTARPLIWPDFGGNAVIPVVEYIKEQGLAVEVLHNDTSVPCDHCNNCIIYAQRPVAGSIITLNSHQPLLVQLYVK